MKVNVHINQSERRFLTGGYQPGDPMKLALTFEAEAESALVLCDQVFAALNTPSPAPLGTLDVAHILAYHQIYPSLSVGDIVEVDGKRYVCQTVVWCAVGTALVNFFGGHVDYDDADDETTGPQKMVLHAQRNDPSDDPEWTAHQERLMTLGALTAQDIKAHRKVASWKDPR